MGPQLKLSVHQLVDFLLRVGDIDNRVYSRATMSEGSRIHSFYQKKQGNEYLSEYYLKETFQIDNFMITLEGRADGIIVYPHKIVIDEIKSTVLDLEAFYNEQGEWHKGQAECYALMYAHEQNLDAIDIRLTYISQVDDSQKVYSFHYTTNELEKKIDSLLRQYLDFYMILYHKKLTRNESCRNLSFPFPTFREGQKRLSKFCFAVATKGGRLFAEAPTGIGKTMSTLYPYVYSFSQGENDKIFYLTAKTSGKEAADSAVEILKKNGLKCSSIIITSKEKICFLEKSSCNPDECPFARNYYGKIQDIIKESILKYHRFDESTILDIASQYEVCPFELELDLSLYCDIIICDYNYAFDPMVYMKRYFDEDTSSFIGLVDEAHNLLERGRGMYSSTVSIKSFFEMKKGTRQLGHKKLKSSIRKLTKVWKIYLDMIENEPVILDECSSSTLKAFDHFLKVGQDILKNYSREIDDTFLDFYFEINRFLKLYELFDDSFALYLERDNGQLSLKLLCLDPSRQLHNRLLQFHGITLFSATLSPNEYYIDVLGGEENDPFLSLPSPFPKENFLLMVMPTISIKYRDRDRTFINVVSAIKSFVSHKMGNYLIFLPSYIYLDVIYNLLMEEDISFELVKQNRQMNDKEKTNFISSFNENPDHTYVALAVLGGVFSEGIDLLGDRLIGAVVVGVGLPTVSFERDLIKDYYEKNNNSGYLYSYVNPGMNRVMQAVGRVIRSEKDRGMVLLIDDRYTTKTYLKLFKNEWSHYQVVDENDMDSTIDKFWNN